MNEPKVGALFRREAAPDVLTSYARTVESLGFDELWVIEDCFFTSGIALAAMGLTATERISVGIGILPAVMRNAATSAMEIATLAGAFPGRFLPGFGHGVADWMRQIGAFPASQLAALEETTTAVRRLLAGETVTMDGRQVRLDAVRLDHRPAQAPPISLGVRAVKSLTIAGRAADGTLLAEPVTPEYLRWARSHIDTGRAAVGRTDAHRITAYARIGIGAEAEQEVRRELAEMFLDGPPVVQLEPLGGLLDEARDLAVRFPSADRLAPELPGSIVRRLAAVGTPADAAEFLRTLAEAGADSVVVVPPADLSLAEAQLETVAREVIPALHA